MLTDIPAPRGARRSDARLKTNVIPIGVFRTAAPPATNTTLRGARRSDERLKANIGTVGARRSDARLKTAITPLSHAA